MALMQTKIPHVSMYVHCNCSYKITINPHPTSSLCLLLVLSCVLLLIKYCIVSMLVCAGACVYVCVICTKNSPYEQDFALYKYRHSYPPPQ